MFPQSIWKSWDLRGWKQPQGRVCVTWQLEVGDCNSKHLQQQISAWLNLPSSLSSMPVVICPLRLSAWILLAFVEFVWSGQLRFLLQVIVTADISLVTFIEILLGVHFHYVPLQINHVAQFLVALVAMWNGSSVSQVIGTAHTFSLKV